MNKTFKQEAKTFKQEAKKIFHIAAFLFITIFFVLPYLVQISTYFHEKGHQKVLTQYGVENVYNVNLLNTIHNFYNPNVKKLGVTKFDLNAYNKLNAYQKAEINLAGIISDLRFLFLVGIYLAFVNIYAFYKVRFKQDYRLVWIMATNWVLFMWLLALIQITVANLTAGGGDFYQLVKVLSS